MKNCLLRNRCQALIWIDRNGNIIKKKVRTYKRIKKKEETEEEKRREREKSFSLGVCAGRADKGVVRAFSSNN